MLLFVALTVAAAVGALRLREEEDLLVFLPTNDADVQLFKDVCRRFGSLRVALVGVEAPAGSDVFAPDVMAKLRRATDAIRNLDGVDRIVSLTRTKDVVQTPNGGDLQPLVGEPPANEAEHAALRDKVMARDHIVGTLVSRDARAALVMVFLADGARDRLVTDGIRRVARAELAGLDVYYGGAPFAGRDIYDEAQRDVWRLSPLALFVLLLVVVLSFQDPVGVLLTVLSVALSTLWVLGAMGWLHEKYTVATSTLPVILFASGSSYAVHVLGRYYLLRREKNATDSIRESLEIVGPPLAIAAGTTSVGFFAFVVTDVAPMRAFGIACGGGVILCWLISLTLVPAVIALWPRAPRGHARLGLVGDGLVALWHWAARRRVLVVAGAILVGAVCLRPMSRVAVRMEPRAFFREGSEPWKAEQFLDEKFGGANFVQVALHGDLDDPWTLREVARLEDYAASLPGVTRVESVLTPLRLASWAFGGGKRLPSTPSQAAELYLFLEGEDGMSALLAEGRRDALLNLRVRGDAHAAVDALERFVARDLRAQPAAPTRDDVADRVGWIARGLGKTPDDLRLHKALRVVAMPGELDEGWVVRRREVVRGFADSDDALTLSDDERAQIRGLAELPRDELERRLAAMPADAQMAVASLRDRLADARRVLGVERALPTALDAAGIAAPDDKPDPAVVARLRPVLDDLFPSAWTQPPRVAVSAKVAGEPILDRGFSRSVGRNLDRSLMVSIVAVLLLLYALFRSVRLSILCMAPSLLTMGVIFGVMGALGVHIDLGTSLVAGIATGAGSDFAMHYMWYLKRQSADEVSRTVGPIMIVSILLVSLGFVVLALGRSPVMRLFGTLAGLSMSLAAFLTCLLVPALLNKVGGGMDSALRASKSQEGSR